MTIYIKSISLIIGDGGSPALNKYGALTALTNGVQWCLFSQENGLYELHDGIKTNLEFIRMGVDTGAIGTGSERLIWLMSQAVELKKVIYLLSTLKNLLV
jgi:hypothetical protein